jgi:hypothetical protein
MTCFETLNPIVEAWTSINFSVEFEMNVRCLGFKHPLEGLIKHLSLESYNCSRGYPYALLFLKIILFSGAIVEIISKCGIFGIPKS